MKTISKRLSAVLLSVYMVFGVVSSDYLTVQAFEWVVPSLTVGESLLWLMGLLGMTYTEGASAWRDVSPEYEQEFIDYANEHGLTYTETSTWLNDAASGKLNQLSDVWTNFKEWVKSLVTYSDANIVYGDLLSNVYNGLISRIFNSSVSINQTNAHCYGFYIIVSYDSSGKPVITQNNCNFFTSDVGYSVVNDTITFNSPCVRWGNSSSIYAPNDLSILWSGGGTVTAFNMSGFGVANTEVYVSSNYADDIAGYSNVHVIPFSETAVNPDSAFDTYDPALIPDINFAGANTEDASIPGVIDLPWGNVGADEDERDKTYDDLVGGLDLGQELGDLWQALQDLMGVLAVDDAGVLQPNSGGENPPTLKDEAENNKANGAFVLTGLQKVFPFCIPFDLYAFITLLEAPPVAPVIQYPIYNPVTKSNEIITIDFSTWESVVILFRYIFDFLFIIGLLLMARALIGGGDSA